ncbi:MAG: PrgI family protein [Lentibacter algarum]|uniref:hypothetical protein n=1 Tax=Lentibacter algarum TaxID=576131 RepID=UPI003B8D82B2
MAKERNIKRISEGANLRELITLGIAFSFGVAALLVIKIFAELGNITNSLAVVVTGAALFAYAAVSYFSNQTKIEPETIGDNCYYLGFLFTLTSLSIALFQISQLGNDVIAYRQLISGFGVALSSTIIGVFLRLILMQGRHDLAARDREARLSLSKATSELRGVLAQSIAEMKSFSVEVTQVLSETATSIAKVAEDARNTQKSSITNETEKSLAAIEGKLASVNQIITKQLTDALTGITQTAGSEMRSFANNSVSESKAAVTELKSEIANTNEQITQLVAALTTSTKGLTNAVDEAVNSIDNFNSTTAMSTNAVAQDLGASIKGLSDQSNDIHKSLQKIQALSRQIEKERANWFVRLLLQIRRNRVG